MSVFHRFAPRLREAITARLGWSSLRAVQEEAGEALLAGANAVILAPTAGGKTEASLFPTLSMLIEDEPEGLGAIYIAPIKALLNNQARRLGEYTEMVGLSRFVWHGDVASAPRKRFLAAPDTLLMTTPESLEVMLISQRVDARALFRDVRAVIIDEVHALAGSDRGTHLLSVIERIAVHSHHDIQRIGLSATVGNPEAILRWLTGSSGREGRVVDPPNPPAARELLVTHRPATEHLARGAARLARGKKSLFFCQSRAMTELVAEHIARADVEVFVHHSAVSKEERELAEARFHEGGAACIVCTSTLELGIDVGDLDRVLQANAPDTVGSFLQRMGRTGRRAGQVANTTFFCESEDAVVQAIALIELARRGWVEDVEVHDRVWAVLLHQVLAMALARSGVTREAAWRQLRRVTDFRGIHRAEYERLVDHLVTTETLYEAGGRLVIGRRGERRFGRRNFMEIYAVFSSPRSYSVVSVEGRPIGTLSQGFVDRLVDEVSSFLLGGRAWVVAAIDHDSRAIRVTPAPRGRQPSWGGITPQFLSFELCQAMRDVLLSDAPYRYLSEDAAAALAERRDALGDVLGAPAGGMTEDGGEVRWWTYAGGRLNITLKHALDALGTPWRISADNFKLTFRGDDALSIGALRSPLDKLRDRATWEDAALWQEIAEGLPSYRLSKFQAVMPPWVEREIIARHLLDVEGAWRFVTGRGREDAGPRVLPGALRSALAGLEAPDAGPVERPAPEGAAVPERPIEDVVDEAALVRACSDLVEQRVIGLDVETTLFDEQLCLIQVATPERTYLIDPLALPDLTPLSEVLESERVVTLIHNASFERRVLARYGLALGGVVDTLVLARSRYPDDTNTLAAVCQRALGVTIDKREQTSNWLQRPLTPGQRDYAALAAEILLRLHPVLDARG